MKAMFKITIKPEYLDECTAYITQHTIHCKSEPGNLTSEAYKSKDDPCVVYLISEWDTAENEHRHITSDADFQFRKKMEGKEAVPVEMFNWTQLA